MDFDAAVSYLERTITYGIKPDLSRIARAVELLDNPQTKYPVIHLTGTNGKTSTSRMIKSILHIHGLKTALYTSPHLLDVTERIELDDGPVSKQVFAQCLADILPMIDETNAAGAGNMTYFEILTALAFVIFSRAKVDVAVIEVGMGGRWDATNVADGKVAVLTNVGRDHLDYLGGDPEAIAEEKADIIKQGAVAVCGERTKSVIDVISKRCHKVGASLNVLGRDFNYTGDRDSLTVNGLFGSYDRLMIGLLGRYQLDNAAMAITACEAYFGHQIDVEKLRKSLKSVKSPGRFEVVKKNPHVVLDGAHNAEGARALMSTLAEELGFSRLIVVAAILADKDYGGILTAIGKSASFLILTKNSSPRCLAPDQMIDIISDTGVSYLIEEDIKKAVKAALALAGPNDLILVTGSLYTVADAKKMFEEKMEPA